MKFYLLILLFPLMACNQTKQTIKKGDEPMSNERTDASSEELIQDCWAERKNVKEVNTKRGSIVFITDYWMIEGEGFRYHPCEIDKDFRVEGMKVVVSGMLREIYPTERRAGAPFSLTAIEAIR